MAEKTSPSTLERGLEPGGFPARESGEAEYAQLYRSLAEAIPHLVWTTLPDGTTDYFNARWLEYTGLELTGQEGAWTLVHPDDVPRCAEAWRAAFSSARPYEIEYRLRRKDGVYRWHLGLANPARDAAGNIVKWIGTSTDIDDQKRAEARQHELTLAEHEARALAEEAQRYLATTLRSIGDAVIATDAAGVVSFMNPVAERLTGWAEAEARGKPLRQVFAVVNERTRKEVENPVDRVLREGAVVALANHSVLLGRGDARETPIDDSGAPIRDDAGKILGVVLVFRDVSPKKRDEMKREFLAEASAALASSLDYKTTLATVARLAVPKLADWCSVEVVQEGRSGSQQLAVAHVDPAKVAMADELGKRYPPDPNSATGVPNVLRTGRSELFKEIPEALLKQSAVDDEHWRLIRELRLESAMVVPLLARGRTLGAITFIFAESGRRYTEDDLAFAEELARRAAVAVDNARLYDAEQRARRSADEANRSKDDFLAAVSHELRTPLNAMLGWARMLRTASLPEERRAHALETIERNAVAQAQLIEDLLDISRIVRGNLRLDVHAVEVVAVVKEAVDSLRIAIDAKAIDVQLMLDANAGPVTGDVTRLRQVVWNLLSNAIKFSPKGGKVRVVLEQRDSNVLLSIIDQGEGIEPEFLPHMFEPFKQADAGTQRKHGGLGLGLSISKHLVELHGGRIDARSRGLGQGATFTVTLPVSAVRRSSSVEPPVAPPPPSTALLRGVRVLVVDDELDSRDLVAAVLESCGAVVVQASSLREALLAFDAGPPEVLLSDIGMPGGDGYELIRRVRERAADQGGAVPAVALTAYARGEDRKKVLAAGFMMHMPKPIDPAELVSVVANLARLRSSQP